MKEDSYLDNEPDTKANIDNNTEQVVKKLSFIYFILFIKTLFCLRQFISHFGEFFLYFILFHMVSIKKYNYKSNNLITYLDAKRQCR